MKKFFMLIVAAASISTMTFAQKQQEKANKENENIPFAVKQAFEKQYPGVKAKWDLEDGKYEADFKMNGNEMSVLYNSNGTVEETEIEISSDQLPKAASGYIAKNKMGRINEVAKIVRVNGEINYEAEVKGKDLIFDSNGKFLKAIKN